MSYQYAYELVAAIFLVLVAVSYTAKNWLPFRANQVFHWLIYTAITFTLFDVFIHVIKNIPEFTTVEIHYVLTIFSSLGMIWMIVLFFVYFLALTEHLEAYTDRLFLELLCPALILAVVTILTPWTKFMFYYDQVVGFHKGPGSILFLIVALGYSLGICVLAFRSPHIFRRSQAILTFVLTILHFAIVMFQYQVLQEQYLLMFYSADFLVVICYMTFQNMDRFSDRISGGFSRAGFRKVVTEKCLYQESFGCLFITIQNYQNLSNICEDGEIYLAMREIGAILRRCGGIHNQYHIHGSDFVVMQKTEEDLIKLFHSVSQQLPATMRINNRKSTINYGYYMLTLEEASYNQSDFYKILSSMKKMLIEQTDSRKLMRYEGEVKETVTLELLIARKLKQVLSNHRYELRFLPMVEKKTGKCNALEVLPFMTKDNGELIPLNAIWSVAKEMGCIKEIGRIIFDNALEFVSSDKLLEKGIDKIHINVIPIHISSQSVIREYSSMAEKHHIPMEKICMEITEDMSVSMETLEKYLILLKEFGVQLMLDHYGENICNLQNVMNMPFDTVKINRQMVHRYCHGGSDILEYQIRMLKESGWGICLEGVDTEEQHERVQALEVEYLQGFYYSRPLSPGRLHTYLEDCHDI